MGSPAWQSALHKIVAPHYPYLSDLGPGNFFLSPRVKFSLVTMAAEPVHTPNHFHITYVEFFWTTSSSIINATMMLNKKWETKEILYRNSIWPIRKLKITNVGVINWWLSEQVWFTALCVMLVVLFSEIIKPFVLTNTLWWPAVQFGCLYQR